ncbi:hypothetical protein C8J56DRAFT_1066121 [Mycena floridula]|nr:hypothetical protein C8J56DRAFT_1066121 [Mycena floridula]
MFVFQTSVNIRKAEADKSNPLFSTSSAKSPIRRLLLTLMAAPSYNNIYSTGIAAGSVDFYDERYTEVRASLANEVAFFAKVKPNPFWLLKEVSYWLATWNGFMSEPEVSVIVQTLAKQPTLLDLVHKAATSDTTYLFFPNIPSEAFNKAEVQEQQDDWRIRASFDTMSRAFDDWRNCCCRTPNSLPASWTKIDGRCDDILDHGFPTVVTSTEDTRLWYLYCYTSLEMLHMPYTQRFIGLFDQLRLRIHAPHLPFFMNAPDYDPLGSRPINRFNIGM